MPGFTVYDPATGRISGAITTADEPEARLNLRAGQDLVAGLFDPAAFTIQNGKAIPGAPPAVPPTVGQLVAYARRRQQAVLSAGVTVNVASSGQPAVNVLVDGTNDTRADLALLALFGQQNPTGTKTWLDNNGVATVLTGVQLVTLSTLAGTWISDTYPALTNLIAQITADKPTITTQAAIDAAAWPTS